MLMFKRKRLLKQTIWNIIADDLYHHSNWCYIYFQDLFTNEKPFVTVRELTEMIKSFPDYCMRLYDVEINNDAIRIKRNNESATIDDVDLKRLRKWAKQLEKYYRKSYKSKQGGYSKLSVSDWPFKELEEIVDSKAINNFVFNNTDLVTVEFDGKVIVIGVK